MTRKWIDTLVFGLTGFIFGIIIIFVIMTKGRRKK